jgi:hypothetical protein
MNTRPIAIEEELTRLDLLLDDCGENDSVRVRVQLETKWVELAGVDEESEAA